MYDDLRAKGGIFRHNGPRYQYQTLRTRSYNDGSLGDDAPATVEQLRRLNIVVGIVGLLVAGMLFNQVLEKAKHA